MISFRPMQATACRRSFPALAAAFQHDRGASARATLYTAYTSPARAADLSRNINEKSLVTRRYLPCAGGKAPVLQRLSENATSKAPGGSTGAVDLPWLLL